MPHEDGRDILGHKHREKINQNHAVFRGTHTCSWEQVDTGQCALHFFKVVVALPKLKKGRR